MCKAEITLEKVDVIRKRTGVNYEEAKSALEIANGDILEAIVYIEREKKLSSQGIYSTVDEIISVIKEIVKKGNVTRIKIFNKEKEILDLPVNAGVLVTGIGIWALSAPMMIALTGIAAAGALTNKITIKIVKNDGSVQVVNTMLQKASDSVKEKVYTPEVKEKLDDLTKNVKDSAKKVTGKVDDLTKNFKGKKNENKSFVVNFDDEDDK